MFIHEAVSKALVGSCMIHRKSDPIKAVFIMEHKHDTIPVKFLGGQIARNWNPTPEELMANDWCVTKEEEL